MIKNVMSVAVFIVFAIVFSSAFGQQQNFDSGDVSLHIFQINDKPQLALSSNLAANYHQNISDQVFSDCHPEAVSIDSFDCDNNTSQNSLAFIGFQIPEPATIAIPCIGGLVTLFLSGLIRNKK